ARPCPTSRNICRWLSPRRRTSRRPIAVPRATARTPRSRQERSNTSADAGPELHAPGLFYEHDDGGQEIFEDDTTCGAAAPAEGDRHETSPPAAASRECTAGAQADERVRVTPARAPRAPLITASTSQPRCRCTARSTIRATAPTSASAATIAS